MNYDEAIKEVNRGNKVVNRGNKVARSIWNNYYVYLSDYPTFKNKVMCSYSKNGGCLTDNIWTIGKFLYYPIKEDRQATDWGVYHD